MPTTIKLKRAYTHKDGKPVRGVQGPGVRGPNRTQAEYDALRLAPAKVIVIENQAPRVSHAQGNPALQTPEGIAALAVKRRLASGTPKPSRADNKLLQQLFQAVGDELVDPQTGWTRITAVVRRVYADALAGKVAQQALVFERYGGKVATPIQVDVKTEITQLLYQSLQSGLRPEELLRDPILHRMAEDSGLIVDGKFVLLPGERKSVV